MGVVAIYQVRNAMKQLLCLLLLTVVSMATTSCVYRRTVVNEEFSRLDLSGIEVGKTTWSEALAKLGPPAVLNTQEGVADNISPRHLRYVSNDQKMIGFNFGYYLIFPLTWTDEQIMEATLVEFDENGVVQSVSRETMKAKWRPFQRHDSIPETVTFMDGGA